MNNRFLSTEEVSFRLAVMKFMAIAAVVYIHAGHPTVTKLHDALPIFHYVPIVFSDYICRFAVPLFFCISGFIYFAKQYSHSTANFTLKKTKDIIFPYILWNSIAILYMFAAQVPSCTHQYFSAEKFIPNFSAAQWISAYIGVSADWRPFLYPLWFMPYLFAAFIIVHPLRKVINQYPGVTWISLAAANIICHSVTPVYDVLLNCGPLLRLLNALSFFTFGIFCIKNMNLFDSKITFFCSGLAFISAAFIDIPKVFIPIKIFPILLYAGVIFIFSLSSRIAQCSSKIKKQLAYISSFSFLIYVMHEFTLYALLKIIFSRFAAEATPVLLVYFTLPIILMSILIICGALLRKLFPKAYKFLFRSN